MKDTEGKEMSFYLSNFSLEKEARAKFYMLTLYSSEMEIDIFMSLN